MPARPLYSERARVQTWSPRRAPCGPVSSLTLYFPSIDTLYLSSLHFVIPFPEKLSEAKESVKSALGMGEEDPSVTEKASEKGHSTKESTKETVAQGADKAAGNVKGSVGK